MEGFQKKKTLPNGDLTSSVVVFFFPFAESVKKTIEKSSIKFIHGVKLDTKIGKSEDRILVSC